MTFKSITALTALAFLSACQSLPSSGPSAKEIELQAQTPDASYANSNYVVIDLTADVAQRVMNHGQTSLASIFSHNTKRGISQTIGKGDTLSITVFEAGEGGLFSSQDGNSARFPTIQVPADGSITLPYTGPIQVIGSTPEQVQARIVERLADKAIQPQVIVTIQSNQANTIVIGGDIAQPGRLPLSLNNETLLDIIALGGGSKFPMHETFVTLVRGNKRGTQLLANIVNSSSENVHIQPGDRIYLKREPNTFLVMGAVRRPGNYPFNVPNISMLEGIAEANGLLDDRSDATGLFLFRKENRALAERFAIIPPEITTDQVQVVYRLNLKTPASYFAARDFKIRKDDTLYVANAKGAEIRKILGIINGGLTSVNNVSSVADRLRN